MSTVVCCSLIDDSVQIVRRRKKYLQGNERSGREKSVFVSAARLVKTSRLCLARPLKIALNWEERRSILVWYVMKWGGLDEKCLGGVIITILMVWSGVHGGTIIQPRKHDSFDNTVVVLCGAVSCVREGFSLPFEAGGFLTYAESSPAELSHRGMIRFFSLSCCCVMYTPSSIYLNSSRKVFRAQAVDCFFFFFSYRTCATRSHTQRARVASLAAIVRYPPKLYCFFY